jgi:CRP/FNR family transcriptional regulator
MLRPRGETYFQQGEIGRGLYCVLAGEVLLEQYDAQGTYTAFRIAGQGELLGYRSLFAQEPHAVSARSLRSSRAGFLSEASVEALLMSNRHLAREFLGVIARDPGPVYAPFLRSPSVPAIVRLTHLLLILKDRYARPWGRSQLHYDLPLSQEQIGGLIGVRRESVSRLFRQLDAAGVCKQRGRKILVRSIERLLEFPEAAQHTWSDRAVSSGGSNQR